MNQSYHWVINESYIGFYPVLYKRRLCWPSLQLFFGMVSRIVKESHRRKTPVVTSLCVLFLQLKSKQPQLLTVVGDRK